ncbi:MAG: hypothetical protein K0R62_4104 [Nonomuraea muscovyensis]|nr:hypothetical protein [Nonomuraea muscovyensis]
MIDGGYTSSHLDEGQVVVLVHQVRVGRGVQSGGVATKTPDRVLDGQHAAFGKCDVPDQLRTGTSRGTWRRVARPDGRVACGSNPSPWWRHAIAWWARTAA